jgi:hypothetical protein
MKFTTNLNTFPFSQALSFNESGKVFCFEFPNNQ